MSPDSSLSRAATGYFHNKGGSRKTASILRLPSFCPFSRAREARDGATSLRGDFVAPADDQQAVAWYRKAANQGLAVAQNNLGVMYMKGQGVPRDAQQAVAWFRKAAEQGLASARINLDAMYSPREALGARPSPEAPLSPPISSVDR